VHIIDRDFPWVTLYL